MDAQSVQTQMADLVEMQKALLDSMKLGPILNSTLVADIKHTSAILEMAGRVVATTTGSIQKRCNEMSQAAKQVIRACDLRSESARRYLGHYAPGGPDGQEALDAEHAKDINEAATMYSGIIGGNYFESPPKYKKSYGPAGVQRVRSERYKRASRQQQENAKTSMGYPNLSTLTLADQEIHGLFSEALVSR
jgi:hypothetical protein